MLSRPSRRLAARATIIAIATAALGTLAPATPASADVTVTPSTGEQGSALKLVFRVTEDRPAAHTTKVELRLPEATPVAEVYPISVPDWAPKMTMRTLDQPIRTLHGVGTRDVVASVTWIRVTAPKVGREPAWELPISLGPLPAADRLVFTVIQTYSDGTVVNWADASTASGAPPSGGPSSGPVTHAAPVLALRPAEPGAGQPDAGYEQPVSDLAGEGSSGGYSIFLSVVIAGVAAGLLWAGLTLWQRQRDIARITGSATPAEPANAAESGKSTGDGDAATPTPSDQRPADAEERPVVGHDVRT
jgi:uncharacterized protein YcnI